jgi:hypothetical protein
MKHAAPGMARGKFGEQLARNSRRSWRNASCRINRDDLRAIRRPRIVDAQL